MDLQSALGNVTESFKKMSKGVTDEMQMCILDCQQCHQVCEKIVQHCLKKGGAHAKPEHIRILQDCADICAVSADFMLRESDLHQSSCQLCSEVCLKCAQSCESLNDDEMMQMCLDVCKRCSDSCQKMSIRH